MEITRRCIRCRKPLRADGTCGNAECVRFTPPADKQTTSKDKNEKK